MRGIFLFLCILTGTGQLFSLTLDDALNLAIRQNTTLTGNILERENDRRAIIIRSRNFLPDLELGYAQSDSVTVGDPDSRVDRISLGVNQLIFSGGRELAALRMAKRELKVKDFSYGSLERSVRHQVVVAFVGVLKNKKILEIQKRAMENLSLQAEIARKEFELGEIRRVDLLDILLEASDYALTLDQTEQELLTSRYELSALLYLRLEQLSDPEGELNEDYTGRFGNKLLKEDFLPRIRAEAERNNQDLISGRLQEMQAYENYKDYRLAWLPRIEATADLAVSGQSYPLNEPSFTLGLDFTFDLPLLPSTLQLQGGQKNPDEYNRSCSTTTGIADNLEGIGDARSAKNNLTMTRMDLENTRRGIEFSLRSAVEELKRSQNRVMILKERLTLQEEKLRIQEQELRLGQITRLNYVESEIDLADQRIEFVENLVSLHTQEEELISLSGVTPNFDGKESLIND